VQRQREAVVPGAWVVSLRWFVEANIVPVGLENVDLLHGPLGGHQLLASFSSSFRSAGLPFRWA
jgi:hypothetical protein